MLDSKRHDCGWPSPAMVTVTRSHQGVVESSVDMPEVAAEARVAADARPRAAITRNTSVSFAPATPATRSPPPPEPPNAAWGIRIRAFVEGHRIGSRID